MKIKEFFQSYGPEVAIVGGIAGMWVAGGLAIFATVKTVRKIDQAEEEKGEKLTFKEKLAIILPRFAAPAVLAVGSTVGVALGTKSELARTAAFASAAQIAERALDAHEKAEERVVGEEKAKEIKKEATKVDVVKQIQKKFDSVDIRIVVDKNEYSFELENIERYKAKDQIIKLMEMV